MKIRVYRTKDTDPEYVELDDTLRSYLREHQDISHLASKEALAKATEYKGLETNNGVLDLGTPISLSAHSEVEKRHKKAGLLYYDVVNNRWRVCTLDGWHTLKLDTYGQ